MLFRHRLPRIFFFLLIFFSVSVFTSSNASAAIIFADSFTDADGTLLQDHNPIWGKSGFSNFSNLYIHSNKATVPGGNNTEYFLKGFYNQTDQCVSADVIFPLSSFVSLNVRADETGSNYYTTAMSEGGYAGLASQNGMLDMTTVLPSAGTHNMKICAIGNKITTYLDNALLLSAIDSSNSEGTVQIGTGNVAGTSIDNFLFTDGQSDMNTSLAVPSLKQTDPIWKDDIYDHATTWSPNNPTIASWGCAMTSAAMIFNYHKITKLPDGTDLTPQTLNKWLKDQTDGYIGNGLVNWLALSRLSKLAQASGYNPDFTFDALEYARTDSFDSSQLASDLGNNIPDILEEPGHFIVAKGIQGNTFSINDPYYSRSTLEEGYDNTFLSLRRFIPSHTDLSYIYVVANKDISLELSDSNENKVGESFTQEPIDNPLEPGSKSGQVVEELLAKNPTSGQYTLRINSPKATNYSLDIYFYDANGEVKQLTLSGFVSDGKSDTYQFLFDHNDHALTSVQKIVTFDSIISDINEAVATGEINPGIGKGLIALVTNAKATKNDDLSIRHLTNAQSLLNSIPDKQILSEAYLVLSDDFSALLLH